MVRLQQDRAVAAEYDDAFALHLDGRKSQRDGRVFLREKGQTLDHALQIVARHARRFGFQRTDAEKHRIKILPQLGERDIPAHHDAGPELHTLPPQDVHTPLHDFLFQLERRNAE